MSDKLLGWDAMKHRRAKQVGVQNAQAIEWVMTHTIHDLEALVDEMNGLGEDVNDIVSLLDDLREIDQNLYLAEAIAPGAYA
jgi:lipoate synthase